jgi:hypothetical protein
MICPTISIDLQERHGLHLGNLKSKWVLREAHERGKGGRADKNPIRAEKVC